MAKRSSPFAILFHVLVALPFCAVGVSAFAHAFVTGVWKSALIGAFFSFAGAMTIRSALRSRATPESRAQRVALGRLDATPVAQPSAYRQSAQNEKRSARDVYALALPTLPVQVLRTGRGTVLPFRLGLASKVGPWGVMVFGGVWSAITSAVFAASFSSGQGLATLVSGVFVAVGALVTIVSAAKVLSRRKLARVEIAEEPVFGGAEVEVYVEQPGPVKMNRITATIRCQERVRYRVGTNTRTETRTVFEHELFDEVTVDVAAGERWSRHVRAPVPRIYSFKAPSNEVIWTVRLEADIASWPDYDEEFPFRVLPPVAEEGAR